MFIHKKACQVPHVLDIVDCPPYDSEHDILYYLRFYDPLYYPEYYPEIFGNVDAVKNWLESSFKTHISDCTVCVPKCFSIVTISISWEKKSYVISFELDGNSQQHFLTFDFLQSSKYSHCSFLSTISGQVPLCPSESTVDKNLPYILDKVLPAWLFYTEDHYKLCLSHLSVSVLAASAKSCLKFSKSHSLPERKKNCYISTIVSHFIADRNHLISSSSSNGLHYHDFVHCVEEIYGQETTALLHEPHFILDKFINRTLKTKIGFFNESIDELVYHLHIISKKDLIKIIKEIPTY